MDINKAEREREVRVYIGVKEEHIVDGYAMCFCPVGHKVINDKNCELGE